MHAHWFCALSFIENIGKYLKTSCSNRGAFTHLFDIAQKRDTSKCPVPGVVLCLKIDGTNILLVGPLWFPVNGTLVQFRILTSRRVNCVNIDHGHLLIQDFRFAFDQFPRSAIQTRALQKKSVHVDSFCRPFFQVFFVVPRDQVLEDHRVQSPAFVSPSHILQSNV